LKNCCVLQDHYGDERDEIVSHSTTKTWRQSGQAIKLFQAPPKISFIFIIIIKSYLFAQKNTTF